MLDCILGYFHIQNMTKESQIYEYRNELCEMGFWCHEKDPNLDRLWSAYYEYKQDLSQLISQSESESIIRGTKGVLCLAALGLLTFGNLNVVEDVLDNIEAFAKTPARYYVLLAELLPLPQEMFPRGKMDAVRGWMSQNKEVLSWDEQKERFDLSV